MADSNQGPEDRQGVPPAGGGPSDAAPPPVPPPPPAYAPTQTYAPGVPQQPTAPQPPQSGQPPQGGQPPQSGGIAYTPTQAYRPGTPPPAGAPTPQPPTAQPPGGGWPATGATGAYPSAQPGGYGYPQAQPLGQPAQGQPNQGGYGYPQPGQPGQPVPPPPGAFGAPGYPAPGAYPQQPYPQPGYPQPAGYPQQPYPGAAAPGFPQPGYGVPGQPGYPQPPRQRKLGGGAVFGIIAGVVVLAAIATVSVLLTTGGGGGGGTGGKTLSKAWFVPSAGDDDELVGSWITSSTVIRASTDAGAVAYSVVDGSKVWSLTPPNGASVPCAMSPTMTTSGIGTMAFGTGKGECTVLAGVDSSTGKILWHFPLTTTDEPDGTSVSTYIQGSVATVIGSEAIGGVNATTGKTIWSAKARGDYCNETGTGASGVVLIDDYCADASPSYTLTALNGSTGKQLWRKSETDHTDFTALLSGNPVTAVISDSGTDSLDVYSATGDATPLSSADLQLSSSGVQSVELPGQTLVVQGGEDTKNDNDSTAGKIVAFDLTTGDVAWTYNGESGHGALLAQPAADGKLYALSTGTFEGSPHFVVLNPTTGASTLLAGLPSDTEGWVFDSGTLYPTKGGGLIALSGYGDEDAVTAYK